MVLAAGAVVSRRGPGPRRLAFALVAAAVVAVAALFVVMNRGTTPASPIDGVVTSVDATGLTEVHGFTLRTSGGATYTFKLGALENATQFSPSHVAEHMATSVPVRVYFTDQAGDHVVYRLEDAPTGSPAAT
jgi:hypothetical protein